MIKVIAIGDLHADFPKLWRALRNSFAVSVTYGPTEPLVQGRYRVVLMGDLGHPKTLADYRKITGFEDYDPENPDHLRVAAKAQIRELNRIKRLQESAPEHITVLMGNHDHAILTGDFILGNAHLEHKEFHPELGGVEVPEDLKTWIGSFPSQLNLFGVNFAHVGPVPWLQSYDALFYEGREAKEWWVKTPDYVERMGHKFGVYGHTVMKNGIQVLDKLAMIDALDHDQYLELILDDNYLDWSICQIPVPSHA